MHAHMHICICSALSRAFAGPRQRVAPLARRSQEAIRHGLHCGTVPSVHPFQLISSTIQGSIQSRCSFL